MMSYLPNSRQSSALTRSLSTPNLINKESSNKKNNKSFKGGLKSWWNKISGRFQNVKNRENKFSHSVSINIIPDEPEDNDDDIIQEINACCANDIKNDTIFVLGFSAATLDLPSNSLSLVQPPHVDEMIVLDNNHGSKIQEVAIDTKKLLNNYHQSTNKHKKSSDIMSQSQDEIKLASKKASTRGGARSVRQILKKINLDSYNHLFVEHEVDLEAFKLLSDADLLEMGIQSSKIRQKILRSIKR